MHVGLVLLAIAAACTIRLMWRGPLSSSIARWPRSLSLFLLPPLLLLTMAIAVIGMGHRGHMLGIPVGRIGCFVAMSFLAGAVGLLLWRAGQGWRSLRQVQTYAPVEVQATPGHLLETPALFAAQVGFWTPRLVVSQGLLQRLNPDYMAAVLAHEQAHAHFHDTFWFFWLGWLRALTGWLPHTEALWQELLLLRELRADQWAAQRVDPLVLAEALLLVAQAPLTEDSLGECSAFAASTPVQRLDERISALIASEAPNNDIGTLQWAWMLIALVPLLTVLIHH